MTSQRRKDFARVYATQRKYFTDAELREWHKHYTTGKGKGMYSSVKPDTTFEEYIINSQAEEDFWKANNI